MPVLYIGSQLVNGTNYCILALQMIVTPEAPKRLVKIVIHVDLDGITTLKSVIEAKIVRSVEIGDMCGQNDYSFTDEEVLICVKRSEDYH